MTRQKIFAATVVLGLSCATWACSGAEGGADLFAPDARTQDEPDAAPSDDSGTAKHDANKTQGADGGAPDAAVVEEEESDGGPIDGGTCGATAAALHPRDPATGLYCPFHPGTPNCGVGQHCCQPSAGSSACAATCAPTTAVDWACQGPSDCVTGVCCGLTQLQPTTCGLTGKLFRGARCQTSCAAAKDEITMCDRPTQCGATERCEPFRARGAELGACVPR